MLLSVTRVDARDSAFLTEQKRCHTIRMGANQIKHSCLCVNGEIRRCELATFDAIRQRCCADLAIELSGERGQGCSGAAFAGGTADV